MKNVDTTTDPLELGCAALVIRPAYLKYEDGEAWAVVRSSDIGKTITVSSEEVNLCILRGRIQAMLNG